MLENIEMWEPSEPFGSTNRELTSKISNGELISNVGHCFWLQGLINGFGLVKHHVECDEALAIALQGSSWEWSHVGDATIQSRVYRDLAVFWGFSFGGVSLLHTQFAWSWKALWLGCWKLVRTICYHYYISIHSFITCHLGWANHITPRGSVNTSSTCVNQQLATPQSTIRVVYVKKNAGNVPYHPIIHTNVMQYHQSWRNFKHFSASEQFAMATHRNVVCPENEGLAMFLFEKWDEMAKKDTYTDRLDATLSKAYWNLCDHKEPIRDLKDASKIKSAHSSSFSIFDVMG